jgi:drug/metabolite transporter superfamily protein YnfA
LLSVLAVALDPVGNISLALQVAILFLLILGLPFFRGQNGKKNFVWHGYSTVAALVLHTILILIVMIPSFTRGFSEFGELTLFNSITVWSHAVLGTTAEILGIILVVAWLRKGPSKMACALWKKWMIPTFIIWTISIINGALVHILGLL